MDGDEVDRQDAASKRFSCSQCDRSFIRREHLTRHSAVHNFSRIHTCSVCFKRFTRSDILLRHESTHIGATSGRKQKAIRSCTACATAKSRCSADLPCPRCISKQIDCHPQADSFHRIRRRDESSEESPRDSASLLEGEGRSPMSQMLCTPPSTSIVATSQETEEHDDLVSQPDLRHSVTNDQIGGIRHFDGPSSVLATISSSRCVGQQESVVESVNHHSPLGLASDVFGMSSIPLTKELYIDGDGVRLPRIRRPKSLRGERMQLEMSTDDHARLCFPPWSAFIAELEDESLRERTFLQRDTWDELRMRFHHYCLTPSALFPSFVSTQFPTRIDFDVMIACYFDSFHQILPLIHMPTAAFEPAEWLLALGVASAGSHFLSGSSQCQYTRALHEFLQRALVFAVGHKVFEFAYVG
jgi:hypothetical protein